MPKYIGEKLDFLMNITNTQNNVLAKALNLDPSYVSRIRSGKRGIPRNLPFIEPAANYFARRIREKYQIDAVRAAILPGEDWPMSSDVAAFVIASWLSDGATEYFRPAVRSPKGKTPSYRSAAEGTTVRNAEHFTATEGYVDNDTGYSQTQPAQYLSAGKDTGAAYHTPGHDPSAAAHSISSGEAAFFYGNSGRRDADELLLMEAIALEKPTTLLLHSDENVSWLFEEPEWTKKWAGLMIRFLQGGGRVRIVHDIGRDIGDMLSALKGCIPLYRYGGIEPYYCPKVRDGVYRRTLQIARGSCAVVSDSIGGDTSGKLNILIRNKDALRALEREWTDFMAFCRPLMDVYGANNRRGLKAKLKEFTEAAGTIYVSPEAGIKLYYKDELGALVCFDSEDSPLGFLIRETRLATSIAEYIHRI